MQAIKISFFGNCGSHHCLYNPLNFQKRKFCSKMVFDQLYLPSKNSFFGNCGSNYRLYKPSKLPKRKFYSKMVFEILIPAIKIAFLVIVGPWSLTSAIKNFLKRKFLFWKITTSLILSYFLFWIVGLHFLFRNFPFWKVTASLILSSFLFGNIM